MLQAPAGAAGRRRERTMGIKGIDHWVIVAGDLQRTPRLLSPGSASPIAWEKRADGRPDMATLRIGDAQKINVHEPRPRPPAPGYLGAGRRPTVGGADFCLEWDGTVARDPRSPREAERRSSAGGRPRATRRCARGPSRPASTSATPTQNLVEAHRLRSVAAPRCRRAGPTAPSAAGRAPRGPPASGPPHVERAALRVR